MYFTFEAASAYADFEADNAEYVIRNSFNNMTLSDHLFSHINRRAVSANEFMKLTLQMLTGEKSFEYYLQEALLAYFGMIVRTRVDIGQGQFTGREMTEVKDDAINRNSNLANEFRLEIVRMCFEHMLKKDPRPLTEQLSVKTLTLLGLTPTLVKFFDRKNCLRFDVSDPKLLVENKNFLIYLGKKGKSLWA